jgi:hypothetical protein
MSAGLGPAGRVNSSHLSHYLGQNSAFYHYLKSFNHGALSIARKLADDPALTILHSRMFLEMLHRTGSGYSGAVGSWLDPGPEDEDKILFLENTLNKCHTYARNPCTVV